jgi:hypothetical protein
MSLTTQEHNAAYDEGRRYRRARRPRESCAKHDRTLRGERLKDARESGWDDEDRDQLALRNAGVRVPA